MANYYTHVTCETAIPCSDEDFKLLRDLMDGPVEDDDDDEPHGLVVLLLGGHLYINDDSGSGDIDAIPREARELIGRIMLKDGRNYWEFGISYDCDKPRPGSKGGETVRILWNGVVERPQITWNTLPSIEACRRSLS